jgi:hypothetical protein
MSFSLHGPLFTVSKATTSTERTITIIPIGKYIYFWGIQVGVKLFDYAGNLIRDIKATNDFARFYALHILRLGQSQTEHFFGYGDGQAPRCTPRTGTCGAEFEKCTDDGICTVLCPTPRYHCDEGNFGAPFYDAKTKLLFIESIATGARIYKYHPVNGYIDDWQMDATFLRDACLGVLPYDETYFYLAWMNYQNPNYFDLYRCKWDTLRNAWKSTTYLKDSCELIVSNIPGAPWRNINTIPEQGGWMIDDGTIIKPDGTRVTAPTTLRRYYATKYALSWTDTTLSIYDLTTLSEILDISLPYTMTDSGFSLMRMPFFVLNDTAKYYIYLLKYGNYAPILQYDPSTRKFRVIDLITGNPITAKVKVWCSSIGYPSGRFPLAITPTEITVSDWTSPPSCNLGALTIEISDIVT